MAPHSSPIDCIKAENDCGPEIIVEQETRKQRVSFSGRISGKLIPSRKQYSKSELTSMFMSKGELDVLKREARETLEKMRSGMQLKDDEEFCTMGLDSGLCTSSEARRLSRQAVMREQALQSDEGSFCDELLAMSYTCYTDKRREFAHQQALQNALEVQAY